MNKDQTIQIRVVDNGFSVTSYSSAHCTSDGELVFSSKIELINYLQNDHFSEAEMASDTLKNR